MSTRLRHLGLGLILVIGACVRSEPHSTHAAQSPAPSVRVRPRLVVQITVDQLRADMLTRFVDRYVEGGLKRFAEHGLHYAVAAYDHAITETAVGHATLFTGASPSEHGIVGNEWVESGQKRTAVQDARYHWLGHEMRPGAGTAPSALRVTTVGDELVRASAGASLVYAISAKDRAAILPAGHAGKAFWYDEQTGDFVTSDYYYREVPVWLTAFLKTRPQDQFPDTWDLLLPRDSYVRRDLDERAFEKPFVGGPSFPHRVFDAAVERYRGLKHTPFVDELTLAAAVALLNAEPLGQDEHPDLLAISFSATDTVGHAFGPESLEAEDNLLRLDRIVARLFDALLARVPERDLLVVLSADHGISETPEHLTALGLDGGRHPDGSALVRELNAALTQRMGSDSAFVERFVNPTLWLDETKIRARGLAVAEVEHAVAELVATRPGVARAFVKSDLARGDVADGAIARLVAASFDPERTGNVYLVAAPGWLLATDPAELAAMHGTPHEYDRAVPIAIWGLGLPAERITRPVDPRDIAPTLSVLLDIRAPSASSGQLLYEALRAH